MKKQTLRSQIGEIEFRKKLFRQQVKREHVFNDEFDAEGIEKILYDRMKKTFDQMTSLKKDGVVLSPYVEIGAERCQRSLVMENELGATGVAVDISYDMLKSCNYYKVIFNKNKVPLRICCDANNLPFMTDSIPFLFCYQTLHHFPDPTPIVKEIHRILSPGGYFFFDEEPYRHILHINLYRGKKIYSKEALSSSKIRKWLNYFFSKNSCNEVEHGVIENVDIPIGLWRQALSLFKKKQIKLQSLKNISSELFCPKSYVKFFLAYLFGGGISGVCCKSGVSDNIDISISDLLICPSCTVNFNESKLTKKKYHFSVANVVINFQ